MVGGTCSCRFQCVRLPGRPQPWPLTAVVLAPVNIARVDVRDVLLGARASARVALLRRTNLLKFALSALSDRETRGARAWEMPIRFDEGGAEQRAGGGPLPSGAQPVGALLEEARAHRQMRESGAALAAHAAGAHVYVLLYEDLKRDREGKAVLQHSLLFVLSMAAEVYM